MSRKLRIEYPGVVVGMQKAEGRMQNGPGGRRKYIMSLKWIAARVQIGTTKGAKSLVHHFHKTPPLAQPIHRSR
jgi:hypothetical protein